jgi:hypothetical protein
VILRDPEGKGPNVSLDRVPEKRSGKRGWLHLDLYAADQDAEVARLIDLGARRYPWRYRPSDDFVVLEDPDHNLFCVVKVPASEMPQIVDFGSGHSSSTQRPPDRQSREERR